jgi:hypothetical protein
MAKNTYEILSDEQLIKKRNMLKGITIGFVIVYLILIASVIYLFAIKGFSKSSIAVLIPLITLPITFVPIVMNITSMNKEIKSRNS